MKKILALLLACIMLTAVLTGCGNKRASTETAAQPATAEQTDATASDGAVVVNGENLNRDELAQAIEDLGYDVIE